LIYAARYYLTAALFYFAAADAAAAAFAGHRLAIAQIAPCYGDATRRYDIKMICCRALLLAAAASRLIRCRHGTLMMPRADFQAAIFSPLLPYVTRADATEVVARYVAGV